MRDHGDETESTVSRDSITVYQTYEEERFGVPTVVLKFVSERDDAAEVRVAIELPPALHIEEVGFHPDYRREAWTVDSDRLEFAAEIRPGEEVTTMYAVESLAADQLDSLLDSLSIEGVAGETTDSGTADSGFDPHPSRRSEHTAGETSAENVTVDDLKAQVETYPEADDEEEATADGVDFGEPPAETASASDEPAGDSDTTPSEVEGESEDDEPLDTLGLAEIDEVEDDETGGDEHDEDNEPSPDTSGHDEPEPDEDADEKTDEDADEKTDEEENAAEETDTATVAAGAAERAALSDYSTAELVAELDDRVAAGGFTDDDRGRLYELLLGETDGATVSDELRVAHLQKRVSDLEAGMEGINEFDARHGPPAEAFAELEEKLATLSGRVETLDREVSSATDEVERLAPRLDNVEDDVDSLADGQEALETEVSTLQEWRERVKSTLQALGDQ